MAHMEKEIVSAAGFEVTTDSGCTFYVPAFEFEGSTETGRILDDMRDYRPETCDGNPASVRMVDGYFGRLSAPGYLDCTDWEFATSKRAILEALRD